MTKIIQLFALLFFFSGIVNAQSVAGDIHGRVTDEKKAGLDFASVTASEGGVIKGGAKTDINGNYKIKPLAPGKYDIKVTYIGYSTQLITGVSVGVDKSVKVDIQMEKKEKTLLGKDTSVIIKAYRVKLIDVSDPGNNIRGVDEIKQTSFDKTTDLIATSVGVVQTGRSGSGNMSIAGQRDGNTLYMIDGMMVRGSRGVNLPRSALSQLELLNNGVSAKYGNATGGIVALTTKGITRQFGGNLQLQHSIDGYNTNIAALDISGPLLKRKNKTGDKVPLIGYAVNIGVTYDKDGDPGYDGYQRLKPDVMKRIQDNPLVPNPSGNEGTFIKASEQVTAKDFETIKAKELGQAMGFTYQGKLDFQPSEGVNVTLGTYAVYSKGRRWSFENTLFAPEANSIEEQLNLRSFLRLTQRLGKPGSAEKQDAKKSAISNAFYSIQATYQKDYSRNEHPDHKNNIFDYGYVGKFKQHRSDNYQSTKSVYGNKGIGYLGQNLDSVTYTPAGINPLLENYTKAVFNTGDVIMNINQVRSLFGLRNGDSPFEAYDLWTGTGTQIGGYAYTEADQISINLDASLDIEQGIKNKTRKDPITHNIQFGLGYDQRTSRNYTLLAPRLWQIMRQNTNSHFAVLDLDNPQYLIGGVIYNQSDLDNGTVIMSPFDTIKYNPIYDGVAQTRIDKELRNKLFGNITNTNTIDVDNLDTKTFSLNMFSADDLINGGEDAVGYFGYDYLGKKLKRQPSFNDFWTKKDGRGDFERPVGSFRPIYMFGYILDKFSYKDLNFNIGLRIDRYDANQKVLKDPYSLYGVRKAGDIASGSYVTAQDLDGQGLAPGVSAFDKDYVVYIDNNQSPKPKVVGYRKGDVWYDPFGKEIADPTVLSAYYNNGIPIQPWLVTAIDSLNGIKGPQYDPNNSFEDFKPQVALSPRIQFAFPISDNALFYGNYDVITQTPTGNSFAGPDDYYYLVERQATIGNANMQMEKAIKYSLGYQQKLSKKAAFTLVTFYNETKNKIQLQRFLLAYPQSYGSYGNRDFASTKGVTLKFDFRRNGPMRMNIDYTLQFAEGTGSSNTSQRSLLSSGQPNLRSVLPLDFDSRHVLNIAVDYRYGMDGRTENKGPKIGRYYPFRNAGANITFRTRSGMPYTRASTAYALTGGDFNSSPIVGSINGSRKPWIYDFGLRVDKNFNLGYYGKVKDNEGAVIKGGKPLFLNVYANVQNLFNTRNTLEVYRYTGVGDDDGYLTSPLGLQALQSKQFKESYSDLYSARYLNPSNYNAPRRINVGLSFDF